MTETPKSLRLQIGLFGRTNVGKSSVLNLIAGQQVAITSAIPGTTTDVVEKSMELLPIGPVVFLDTAGIDDVSGLAGKRIDKTKQIYKRADIAVLVIEANIWNVYEDRVVENCRSAGIPLICLINKSDLAASDPSFIKTLQNNSSLKSVLPFCALDCNKRNDYINEFKRAVFSLLPEDFITPPHLVGDLIPPGGHVMLIVPIDIEAPKGRIILPQVQTIRDTLDGDCFATIVKEHQYKGALANCVRPPDLVVCDSQVVDLMVRETPREIPCTTFSTLFSRYKGDLEQQLKGTAVLDNLKIGDRVLISEACSHHPMADDIGRVKIPHWLKSYLGFTPDIDVFSGRDYPDNLKDYSLVIHCGGCMLTRREMLMRIEIAREAKVPITNYGLVISRLHGTLDRIIAPFKVAKEIER